MGIERRAEVTWAGPLEDGHGALSTESQIMMGIPVTWSARVDAETIGRTNPEELLAAAHATCYAMSLSAALGRRGVTPRLLDVVATCGLDRTDQGLRVASMLLRVTVSVHGDLGADALEETARLAEEACPISRALRGNVDVRVEARLREEREGAPVREGAPLEPSTGSPNDPE